MSCKGKTGAALKACQKAAKDRLAKKAANVTNTVVGEAQKVGNFFKRTFKNRKICNYFYPKFWLLEGANQFIIFWKNACNQHLT